MKKRILLLVIFIILLVVALILLFLNKTGNLEKKDLGSSLDSYKEENTYKNLNNDSFDNKTEEDFINNNIGGNSGGSSGGSASDSVINEENKIPDDVDTQNCGFYFNDYNICGGKCIEGECVSEGRSCYCKK